MKILFYGEYDHTIDEKGRLIVPSKFREELGVSFIVTKGLDGCLFVYSKNEWAILETEINSLPLTKGDARAFSRFLFAGATEVEIDKQGRILVAPNLRSAAKISKDVIVIGVGTRVEIWNKETWENYCNNGDVSPEDIAEKLSDLGI